MCLVHSVRILCLEHSVCMRTHTPPADEISKRSLGVFDVSGHAEDQLPIHHLLKSCECNRVALPPNDEARYHVGCEHLARMRHAWQAWARARFFAWARVECCGVCLSISSLLS